MTVVQVVNSYNKRYLANLPVSWESSIKPGGLQRWLLCIPVLVGTLNIEVLVYTNSTDVFLPTPKTPHITFSAPGRILSKLSNFIDSVSNLLRKDYIKDFKHYVKHLISCQSSAGISIWQWAVLKIVSLITILTTPLTFPYNHSRLSFRVIGHSRGSLWQDCRHSSDLGKHITIRPSFLNRNIPGKHYSTLSKTRNASLISSSLSVSFIFLAIIVRNSGKSIVPLPERELLC